MRRRSVVVAVVVLIAAGLSAWLVLRGRGVDGAAGVGERGAPGGASGGSSSDVIARKRAARKEAPIDETPASAAGRVTAKADGRALAGADVILTQVGGEERNDGEPRHARTAPDGTWVVEGLDPGRWVVAAGAEGFAPARTAELELAPRDARTGIDLALEAGGILVSGTVTDIGGGAIAEALVTAASMGFDDDEGATGTLTGDDGGYRLSVKAGTYGLSASHAVYARSTRTVVIQGPQTVHFELVPGGTISGRVLTREGKRPVPRAGVEIGPGGGRRRRGFRGHAAIADAEGRFTVRGLEPGELAVTASGRNVSSAEPTQIDLGVGEELTDVEVLVDTAYTVSGFVVKKGTELGIRGVAVGGFSMKEANVQAARPTEADGYFQLDGVRPGTYMLYAHGDDEYLPTMMQQSFTVVDKDLTDVLVELASGFTISGRVEPATVARISLEVSEVGLGNMGAAMAAGMSKESSGSDGRFTLKAVPDGKLEVVARTEDGRKGTALVEVSGKSVADVVVKLEERGSISGTVTDRATRPVAGARVRAERKRAEGEGRSFDFDELLGGGAVVQADGTFLLRGLEAGNYKLRVHGEHGILPWANAPHRAKAREPIEVVVAAEQAKTGVALVVERADGVIRGVVVGADGKPAADAFVSVERTKVPKVAAPGDKQTMSVSITLGGDSAGASVTNEEGDGVDEDRSDFMFSRPIDPVMTDATGRFTIGGLGQGPYDVNAEALRGAGRGTVTSVRPGASVTIRLEALGGLTGIVSLAGAPVAGYTIDAKGPVESRATGGADGRYVMSRLQAGTYDLKVIAQAGVATAKATVTAGAPQAVNLTVVAWGKVTGIVVDARTGKPMAGVRVMGLSKGAIDEDAMISALMGGGSGPRADSAGRFEVGRLGEGDGVILFLPSTPLAGFEPLGTHRFSLTAGQSLDVGTVKVLAPGPKAATAGMLGIELDSRRWADRPGATAAEPPEGVSASERLLWVVGVTPGNPAAVAGLKVGDRVLAIDGFRVGDVDADAVAGLIASGHVSEGQKVTLTLERGDVILTAAAAAAAVPAP